MNDWNKTHLIFIDGDCLYFASAPAAIEWACGGDRFFANKKLAQLTLHERADNGQWAVMSEVKYLELVSEKRNQDY